LEYKKCSRCDYEETRILTALDHTWSDWETTTPATVAAEGEQTRTCPLCEEAETRPIDRLPDNGNNNNNQSSGNSGSGSGSGSDTTTPPATDTNPPPSDDSGNNDNQSSGNDNQETGGGNNNNVTEVSVENVGVDINEGMIITDEKGEVVTIENPDSLKVHVVESDENLESILESLALSFGSDAGAEEVRQAIDALFRSLEDENFDTGRALIFTFDISLDYGGNNIIDLGDGTVNITFAVPDEFREEGMRLLFFGIHRNADGTHEFILISDDLIADANGNVTVNLSKFSNYFLMAAPPNTDVARIQTVDPVQTSDVTAVMTLAVDVTASPVGIAPPAAMGTGITPAGADTGIDAPARVQEVEIIPETPPQTQDAPPVAEPEAPPPNISDAPDVPATPLFSPAVFTEGEQDEGGSMVLIIAGAVAIVAVFSGGAIFMTRKKKGN
jgi:hypothetical protein